MQGIVYCQILLYCCCCFFFVCLFVSSVFDQWEKESREGDVELGARDQLLYAVESVYEIKGPCLRLKKK